MGDVAGALDDMVLTLVPSLSRSLAEQFNIFRVMHHGTHEKQLSNVFAWLLHPDATHGLGDAFQQIFIEHVNRSLPEASKVPVSGYQVLQEIDTAGHEEPNKDIADIVLSSPGTSLVVENFEWSDGHGHDYHRYLAYGAAGNKQSVVVLLCARHEPHLQTNGWEHAVVVTYAELVQALEEHVGQEAAWRHSHQQQAFFIQQLVQHFTEGPQAVSNEDQIAFINAMCQTGESARYGHQPQERAAEEFAESVAQHAKQQFEDSRKTLSDVKTTLRRCARHTLAPRLNSVLQSGTITKVRASFRGQWEWCVKLERADLHPPLYLEFGPTAVVENARSPDPMTEPDYTKIFVTRLDAESEGIDRIFQTDVGLVEVLDGLSAEDTRLHDSVLAVIGA